MEYLSLFLHITAGTLTLLAGPAAIYFSIKHPGYHRVAGRVFFYAMVVVCATAVVRFLQQPDRLFFQFLLGIALLVLGNIIRGIRAIRLMKGGVVIPLDFGYLTVMGITGLAMSGVSLRLWLEGVPVAFPVLFGVFGLAGLADAASNFRQFLRPIQVHRFDWYRIHVGSMLGAFTASTTAFTVNAAPFLPWYLQWFGPTVLLLPVQIYFARLIKEQKRVAQQRATTFTT